LVSDKTEISLPPSKPEILIGRIDPQQGSFPDIDLTNFDRDKSTVSRQHARLIALGEGVFIEDLESTNYTFLNKAKLEPAVRYPLNDGDEIRIGGVVLIYYAS
jgi:pSer/pThr/pTyr-binding forkhead associated (FHA) protein